MTWPGASCAPGGLSYISNSTVCVSVTGGGKLAPVLKSRAAYCCLLKLVLGENLFGAVGWKPGTLGLLWGHTDGWQSSQALSGQEALLPVTQSHLTSLSLYPKPG